MNILQTEFEGLFVMDFQALRGDLVPDRSGCGYLRALPLDLRFAVNGPDYSIRAEPKPSPDSLSNSTALHLHRLPRNRSL